MYFLVRYFQTMESRILAIFPYPNGFCHRSANFYARGISGGPIHDGKCSMKSIASPVDSTFRHFQMANGFFMVLNGIIVSLFFILPADRQLAVPDLFTFFRDRLYDLHEYWSKRTTDEKTIMRKDSRENVTGTEAYEDYKED